jgi:hypothetical protein
MTDEAINGAAPNTEENVNTAVPQEPVNDGPSLRDQLTEALNAGTQPPQDQQAQADRARDDKGRFATKPAETVTAPDATKPATDTAQKAPEQNAAQPDQETAPAKPSGPPPGWSVAAKAEFDALPDAVKQAVAKREEEVNNGFKKLSDYKGLDQYVELAQKNNTTLPEVMERYVSAEQFLDRDPAQGIAWLMQNYDVTPQMLLQGYGHLWGIQNGQQQPGQAQPAQVPGQPPQPDLSQILQPVLSRVNAIERQFQSQHQSRVANEVESFFANPANKYAENVADQMVSLIKMEQASGRVPDLAKIYETACYTNPEVRQQLIKEQTAKSAADQAAKARAVSNQARAAGASLTGGPATTPPPASPTTDLRAQLEQGMAELMGRV